MIDTIKVQIPLTEQQFAAILQKSSDVDREQWAKVNLQSGELRFLRIDGLAGTDQNSFHRDIRWDVPPSWHPGRTHLVIELSLPKLYYGDNIRLLYDSMAALELLRMFLNRTFGFRTTRQLPSPATWLVTRLDVCYAWRFPDQGHADHFFKSLSNQRFPYKEPTKRPTTLMFTSGSKATYSAKFYLKLPEFLANDAKALRKSHAPESEIRFREHLAAGLLRFEVTLRQKWLKRREILTVADVLKPIKRWHFDEDLVKALMPFFNPKLTASCIIALGYEHHVDHPDWAKGPDGEITLRDGDYFSLPAGEYAYGRHIYKHPGGGFRVEIVDDPVQRILQEMLEKMVGRDAQLALADRVKQKLSEVYKPATAANLTAFWLFVQKFGSEDAMQTYGRDAFYYKRRQLRKAQISLLENRENSIMVGKSFFNDFKLAIPSDYPANAVDDSRDSRSVLNLFEYRKPSTEQSDQAQ